MTKTFRPIAALAFALAVLAAPLSGASAQGVGLSSASFQNQPAASTGYFADAGQIAAYLRSRGQAAQVGTDKDGDPRIETSSQGARYNIFFYGCTNGQNCTSISLESGFRLQNNATLEQLNAWNYAKRYAYAVQRPDKSFALRMDIEMSGGVTEPAFLESMRLWDSQLGGFLRHINY